MSERALEIYENFLKMEDEILIGKLSKLIHQTVEIQGWGCYHPGPGLYCCEGLARTILSSDVLREILGRVDENSEHEKSLRSMETMAKTLDVVYGLLATPPVNPPAGESGEKVRLWDEMP